MPDEANNPEASDWVKVAEEAVKPTVAIPITPLQQRAAGLRRELMARPDADRAIQTLRAILIGARYVRPEERAKAATAIGRAVREQRASHGRPGGKKRHVDAAPLHADIIAKWTAEYQRRAKTGRKVGLGKVDDVVAKAVGRKPMTIYRVTRAVGLRKR